MNFFGHACVAAWRRREPAFVLGAMLPDFAAMTRVRLAEPASEQLRAGVTLHHRTDAVFHSLEAFLRPYLAGARTLRERGVARGASRAAAHLGVELLLDGELAGRAADLGSFEAALAAAHDPQLDRAIRWRELDGRARWHQLRDRVGTGGGPRAYLSPGLVAERIERALRERPRLRLDPGHVPVLTRWLEELAPEVRRLAPQIVRALESGLGRVESPYNAEPRGREGPQGDHG